MLTSYINAEMAKMKNNGVIKLYSKDAFESMRKACQLTAQCLDEVHDLVKPGIATQEIDKFIFEFGMSHNAPPATLNYRGYQYSCCISINHVVCHGMPSDRILKDGDIVNVDVTFVLDGWHGDSSRMYVAGTPKRAAQRLIDVTYNCLMAGIEQVKPDNRIGAIGEAIEEVAHKERCSVVQDFCGHGIGRLFHDAPNILHYGRKNEGAEMKEGMIFTIEPMINLGKHNVKILGDGWTAVTRDKSLSAQFEHTIGVTENGYEIFTTSPKNIFKPK